jgi:hypothetical protein
MEEHINENKQAENEAEPRQPRRKNRVTELLFEMWPAYLIEVVVIILGIWITLGLDQWREHVKDKELAVTYSKSLLRNLNDDRQSLKYCVDQTNNVLSRLNELLVLAQNPTRPHISLARTDSDLLAILNRPKFISRDATFSDLKGSGNMRLFANMELKELLFAYYGMAQNIKESQDAEQQATINITGPYFFKNFALGNPGAQQLTGPQFQALAAGVEFGNNIALRLSNRRELMAGYVKADSMAVKITKLLEEDGE